MSTTRDTNEIPILNYRLGRTIGTGAFAKVKIAEHVVTGAKVAVKIINQRKMIEQAMWPRIKREISLMKILRHPHIITLYEVLSTSSDIIMVMEYAPDELFQRILDHGAMPEPQARRYFQQIISALEYCHRHKIAHRDLKPENLLLATGDSVKIADFGLSNEMRDGDFLKTSCGSPNYAAPEVINGQPYSGPEVDIWSAGVILYVLLVGRLPFDADYIPSLFRLINAGKFDIPPTISIEAADILRSMLVVDPVKRATVADIQQHPWFLQDLPTYLRPLPVDTKVDTLSAEIDKSVVQQLSDKLHLSEDEIWAALRSPAGGDPVPDDELTSSVKVAYRIICDQQKYFNNPVEESVISNHGANRISLASGELENIIFNHGTKSENIPSGKSNSPTLPKVLPVAPRWHFGIRSKSSPKEILLELYKVLTKLDMSWCDPTAGLYRQHNPKTPHGLESVSADYFSIGTNPNMAMTTGVATSVANSDGDFDENDAFCTPIDPYRIRIRANQSPIVVFELQLYSTPAAEVTAATRANNSNVRRSDDASKMLSTYIVDVKYCPDEMPKADPLLFLDTVGRLIAELLH